MLIICMSCETSELFHVNPQPRNVKKVQNEVREKSRLWETNISSKLNPGRSRAEEKHERIANLSTQENTAPSQESFSRKFKRYG